MVFVSWLLGLLLLSGRAILISILIAVYIFKTYLVRPYVDLLLPYLNTNQYEYIIKNNYFFNADDASKVYLHLLGLLFFWLIGLHIVKPIQLEKIHVPKIFSRVDSIIQEGNWRCWSGLIILAFLNYRDAIESWQGSFQLGTTDNEATALFALGLFDPYLIYYICLYIFLTQKKLKENPKYWLLLPIGFAAIQGMINGSRGALFWILVGGLSYWFFLNFNKNITVKDVKRFFYLTATLPVVIFIALVAQVIRPLLRYGSTASNPEIIPQLIRDGITNSFNFSDPENPVFKTIYFGLTELFHRISALQAQFLIINDRYFHNPWEFYNPIQTTMRIVNGLVPGDPFPGLLSINQLYDFIYHNATVSYNSEMWGIQSTLYLYYGMWLSPIFVFFVAVLFGRYRIMIDKISLMSPAFAVFFVFLFNDLMENGTLERIIPLDIVRAFTSYLGFIFLVKLIYFIFPEKRKLT